RSRLGDWACRVADLTSTWIGELKKDTDSGSWGQGCSGGKSQNIWAVCRIRIGSYTRFILQSNTRSQIIERNIDRPRDNGLQSVSNLDRLDRSLRTYIHFQSAAANLYRRNPRR